ncbi:MAG: hypothetical protein HAW67_03940 [Endozoicomonadaceae bacterium]|nr:hypothetical protein [Endozoicomonadaceae bacterium]
MNEPSDNVAETIANTVDDIEPHPAGYEEMCLSSALRVRLIVEAARGRGDTFITHNQKTADF